MNGSRDPLAAFRDDYLDYLEGLRDAPPAMDHLDAGQRQRAASYVESISQARGVDPYASPPSVEQLLATAASFDEQRQVDQLGQDLQLHLRYHVDSRAAVAVDIPAGYAGIPSRLLIRARGLRIRVVTEPPGSDLDETYPKRVAAMAAIFGAFQDTNAVLYTTIGADPVGTVVDYQDLQTAFETPSGLRRPPRLWRPIAVTAIACNAWLADAIPAFEDLPDVAVMGELDEVADPEALATAVVNEIVDAGRRARIEAKRSTWSQLGGSEISALAALVHDAQQAPISLDEYQQRIERLVGDAA